MTVVIITHNLALTAIGDKVIRIKSGKVDRVEVNPHPMDVEKVEW